MPLPNHPRVQVLWAFLCEALEMDGDRVVSLTRLVRAQPGFGPRTLPLVLRPHFAVSLVAAPREELTLTTSVSDGRRAPVVRNHAMVMGPNGEAEVGIPLGKLTIAEPGVFEFSLSVNGQPVLMVRAPLERAV